MYETPTTTQTVAEAKQVELECLALCNEAFAANNNAKAVLRKARANTDVAKRRAEQVPHSIEELLKCALNSPRTGKSFWFCGTEAYNSGPNEIIVRLDRTKNNSIWYRADEHQDWKVVNVIINSSHYDYIYLKYEPYACM